ncbi:MAG: hypothetical protein A2V67_18605 [Deltaproteobacteria bacterium RBG_13_61_14]|nr:MAG: hypothetical protein A2V67_18605 [Deltaproteobacteria bacterium RBG_13_61_14]
MNKLWGFIVAYFLRWFPHGLEPGLRRIGNPGPESPVLVSGNFSLTLKRLIRSLVGQDLWLLVANSRGINVWCAAVGGMFTHHNVIAAIKTSGLADQVRHREVILPQLCAAGMDVKAIREEAGFQVRFGPVRAEDLPAYLAQGKKKTDAMSRFRFDLRHRLDMLLSNNTMFYLIVAIPLAIFWPHRLLAFTLLFWAAAFYLYLLFPYLPGKTGWSRSLYSALAVVLAIPAADFFRAGQPFLHYGWMIAVVLVFSTVGFDAAGILAAMPSDAEAFLHRLGIKRLGSLLQEKTLGRVALDREKCRGDMICYSICPVGVFGELDPDKKITLPWQNACFACGACVKQCPHDALSLQPRP